MVREG
jgi:hypothetical protein